MLAQNAQGQRRESSMLYDRMLRVMKCFLREPRLGRMGAGLPSRGTSNAVRALADKHAGRAGARRYPEGIYT